MTMRCAAAALLAFAVSAFTHAGTARGADGNLERGQRVYTRCLACHALQTNLVGPRHCGVFGRRAGTLPGYDYSPAMRASNIVWNATTLDRFLADPMKAVPGTSMTYSGVPDAAERAALIAWLKQASTAPACGR